MKLKHVLFSSLFLSAGLVACTNDEFAEIQTPSADVENGISLGEGFTISGMKFAETPDTKAYFEVNNGLNAYWEETDVVGAAWYNMVEGIDKETGLVTASSSINANHEYFSNTDFNFLEFIGGDKGSARFEANTNVMAGAYVMYYPWDESVAQVSDAIPVKRKFPCTVDLTEGHEFDAVSERMFSYGVAAFVPGGRQTRYFQLEQVPVLYRLRFGAEELQLVNLEKDPLVIDRIIFEAYDNTGKSVLTTEGTVTPTQLISKDYNNYIEWLEKGDATVSNPLPAAVYKGDETKVVGHYTIVLNNSDQPAYRIDALEEEGLTEGAVVFSALPFIKPAAKVVVKIITSNGINLSKVYTDAYNLNIFNNATEEGGFVMNDIYVDSQTDDKTIYTRDQFLAQWNDAVENQKTATLTIADPVMLEDVALSTPDLNGANITINIKRGDNADLTIGSIDLQGKGSLTIKSDVVVKGNVRSWSNNKLTITGELEANDIRVGGKAELTVKKMNSLYVEDSGEMTLTVSDNAERADIGNITVEGDGELTMAGGFITSINGGNKPITLNNKVTNYGNFDGALEGTGTFVNEGTFNGAVASGVKFTNEAGAKATIANKKSANMTLVNEAAADGKDAGVVTINSEKVSLTLASGSTNDGVINVVKGTMTGVYNNNGRIYVEKDATLNATGAATNVGWVVLNDVDANLGTGYTATKNQNGARGYNTALSVKDPANIGKDEDCGTTWQWIDAPMDITKEVNDAYINANVTLGTNASLTGLTRISETVTFNLAGELTDLTVNVNNLNVTGHLTIANGITLTGEVESSADFQHITGDISNLTVKGSN